MGFDNLIQCFEEPKIRELKKKNINEDKLKADDTFLMFLFG